MTKTNKRKIRTGIRTRRSFVAGGNGGSRMVSRPPPLASVIERETSFVKTFRFNAESSAATGCTRQCLLNLMGVSTSATAATRIISAILIKKIRIWLAPPASATSPQYLTFMWGSTYGSDTALTMTNLGYSTITSIETRPPRSSTASFWSSSGSNATDVLFNLDASTGDVVILDLTAEIKIGSYSTAIGSLGSMTNAGATMTAGVVVYNWLDSTTSGKYGPSPTLSGSTVPLS